MNRYHTLYLTTFFLLVLSSGICLGQVDTHWTGAEGDYFTNPANWSNGAPGQADTANLDLGTDYQIFLNDDVELDVLRLYKPGTVTFYGQNNLSSNFIEIFQNAYLWIDNETNFLTSNGLFVGNFDDGRLRVQGGSEFKSLASATNIIGKEPNVLGLVEVIGPNTLFSSGGLTVGEEGVGYVTVHTDSYLLVVGDTTIGRFSTSEGDANVFGGATWECTENFTIGSELNSCGCFLAAGSGTTFETGDSDDDFLYVGKNGSGSLSISQNAFARSQSVVVGSEFAGVGEVSISTGGFWQVDGSEFTVGAETDSVGSISVTGPSSNLDINSSMANIGFEGQGSISIDDGADVHIRTTRIGFRPGGQGEVCVANNSSLNAGAATIALGLNTASGVLSIESGATVNSAALQLRGFISTGSAEVNVVGNGSTLSCSHLLGSGVLTIDDGGLVDVLVNAEIPADSTINDGVVYIGPNSTLDVSNAIGIGTVNAAPGTVTIDNGLLIAEFNTFIAPNGTVNITDGTIQSLVLTNRGTIFAPSGSAELVANVRNNASGLITASSLATSVNFIGSLENEGEVRTSSGATTNCFAIWSGTGPFTGSGTVCFRGIMEPGNDVFNIFFEGNVVMESTATTRMEIGGTQNLNYDQLFVQGDLDVQNAQLEVSIIDNFQLSEGDTFLLANVVGNQTGQFDSLPEGAIAGNFGSLSLQITYKGGDGNDIVLTAIPSAILIGDVNLDGSADLLDVVPFVDRITTGNYQVEADCNEDGSIDLLDVNPFVNILTGM